MIRHAIINWTTWIALAFSWASFAAAINFEVTLSDARVSLRPQSAWQAYPPVGPETFFTTAEPNSFASLIFTGDEASVYYRLHSIGSVMHVLLDGVVVRSIDTYDTLEENIYFSALVVHHTAVQAPFYGEHNITIVNGGRSPQDLSDLAPSLDVIRFGYRDNGEEISASILLVQTGPNNADAQPSIKLTN